MKKRFFKHAVITFTFIVAVTNAGFYIADSITGKPILANTLKVLGFCPAPAIEGISQSEIPDGPIAITGPTGTKGEKGNTGATGKPGVTGSTGAVGATGAPGLNGETGATGAQGEPGQNGASGGGGSTVCQAPINLISLPGDLIPAVDNLSITELALLILSATWVGATVFSIPFFTKAFPPVFNNPPTGARSEAILAGSCANVFLKDPGSPK
jgi:hypothetical protein